MWAQQDPIFIQAVEAIDTGNAALMATLLREHPRLVQDRLDNHEEGYFKNPYLMWFVADNPIRHECLPGNILEIMQLILEAAKASAGENLPDQVNYTLGLVATGRIPRESGLQNAMMDLLIEAGGRPDNGIGALAHGNPEAAAHLIEKGGELTLPAAVGLGMDTAQLLGAAADSDKELALLVAAYYGKAPAIVMLISGGVDVNARPDDYKGFHSHASALHQAVASGSLESVRLLVEAGARLDVIDGIYHGTPLGWADYLQRDGEPKYAVIEKYLAGR